MIEYKRIAFSKEGFKRLDELGKEGWKHYDTYKDIMFLSRELKRTVNRKQLVETQEFRDFYALYPRKQSPQQALKEWVRLKDDEIKKVFEVLPYHVESWKHKYGTRFSRGKVRIDKEEFVPHPSTWLSAKKFNDEIEINGMSIDDVKTHQEFIKKVDTQQKIKDDVLKQEKKLLQHIASIIKQLEKQGKYEGVKQKAIDYMKSIGKDSPIGPVVDLYCREEVKKNIKYYESLLTYE